MPGADLELAPDAPIALVVEDDRDAARIAGGLLRMLGYRSRIAVDSTEALYALSEGLPSLMLMDVCLPMMDGLSLLKVARRIEGMRAVPVVAVSAVYPEDGAVARGLAGQGITAYLGKPYTLNGLRAAIDEARSAALRVGPAPEPSMGEGLRKVTDDDMRDWETGKSEPVAPEPPPPPPPATVEPPAPRPEAAPRPAPPPDPTPRQAHKDPPSRSSGRMPAVGEADRSLDFPAVDTNENELPEEPAEEVTTQVLEIYAQAIVGRRRLMATVDRCTRSSMTLRTREEPMSKGDMVRLEVNHRMAIQDAMKEILVRLLGTVLRVEESGHEWKHELRIMAARPAHAYDNLIEYFERFRQ